MDRPLADSPDLATPRDDLDDTLVRAIDAGHLDPSQAGDAKLAAALRSASLQRQVGAVVASPEGDIVAAGANEVPRAGGGLCWAGDEPDQRDFVLGEETNDRLKWASRRRRKVR